MSVATPAGLALRQADARTIAAAIMRRLGIADSASTTRAGARVDPDTTRLPRTVVLTPAQLDAVERAAHALQSRGGVLLADPTGTGKTFLALALIDRALSLGSRRVLVTGPAALAAQWTPHLRKVAHAYGGRLLTCRGGRTEHAGADPLVAWLSHAMLSLGRWPPPVDSPDLVVVDEAHAFRNPSTRRHRSLAWLCRSAHVVLLTATPINNSLMDLYFLFRLFVGDGALDDLGVPDLEAAFRAAAEAGGPVRPPLDAAIDALTVRTRTRRVASWRASPGDDPPDRPRVQPVAVRYDLDVDGKGAARIVDGIRRLHLSAYAVTPAGRPPVGGELVRFGLVKRLESSVAAFSTSARSLRGYLGAFADAATAGFWLSPASHRAFTADDPGQLLLAPLALPRLPPGFDPDRLTAEALTDAAALRRMAECTAGNNRDLKADILVALLADGLADRKVLVFTEFRDTALHLWKVLRTRTRVGLIHGSKAMLGDEPAGRLEVVRRFAPLANGAAPDPVERVKVLIATDVLAEGFNLQDAADVISYDLPWNPVRLIQRIGRIDRTGSPHRVVRCHNFIPDRTLDLYLGLVERIRAKLETIRAGPGRTGLRGPFAGISGSNGSAPLVRGLACDAISDGQRSGGLWRPQVESGGRRGADAESGGQRRPQVESAPRRGPPTPFAVAVRSTTLLRRLGDEGPGLFDEFEEAADPIAGLGVPEVSSGTAEVPASGRTWLVAVASGPRSPRLIMVRAGSGQPDVRPDRLRAVRLLDAIRSGRVGARAWIPAPVGGACDATASPGAGRAGCGIVTDGSLCAAAAAIAALEEPAATPTGANGRRGILIRKLLRLIAREPGRPDPRLIERVDRLVSAMHPGLRAGVETAVAACIASAAAERRWRPGRTVRLVNELEALVDSTRETSDDADRRDMCPRVIAVFEPGSRNETGSC